MNQLDEITLTELEVDLFYKFAPEFMAIDIVEGELKIIVCSSSFDDTSTKDRIKKVFDLLDESYYSLKEKIPIIVNCYNVNEMNDILSGL